MTTEQYQQRMAAMGIGRGAFCGDFPNDEGPLGNGAIGHEPSLLNRRARTKVNRAVLGLPVEDLTHLNPARSAKGGRPRNP